MIPCRRLGAYRRHGGNHDFIDDRPRTHGYDDQGRHRRSPCGRFPDPTWVENYQWLATDADGVGFICHIGTHIADPRLWHVVTAVSLPGGAVYVAKSCGESPDRNNTAGTAIHGATCTTAFEDWTVSANGGFQPTDFPELGAGLLTDRKTTPVRARLRFEAFGRVWDPGEVAGHPEIGHFHYEQPIRVTGTIEIDGTERSFDGYGYRDHSRGPREMGDVERSWWCNGVFPSGRTFCSLTLQRRNGDRMAIGAILHADGSIEPAALTSEPALHNAAHEPYDISLTLCDSDGVEHAIEGTVTGGGTWSIVGGSECCLGAALLDDDAYILPQSIIRWTWEGETGYGLADRCANRRILREGT